MTIIGGTIESVTIGGRTIRPIAADIRLDPPDDFWPRFFQQALLSGRQQRRVMMREALERRMRARREPHPATAERWYRAWQRIEDAVLTELARECQCCPNCTCAPCAGLSAGGLCDRYCHCGELDGFGRDDFYDDRSEDDDDDF